MDRIWGNTVAETRVPAEVLEVIADVLLASAGNDERYPAYNDHQLGRKRQRAARAEGQHATLAAERMTADADDDDLSPVLPRSEREVWRLYREGWNPMEISRRLGIARSTVVRVLSRVARRLAVDDASFGGLKSIYASEVRRRIYRRPVHCAEKPCRRLGYCKYAM